MLHQPLSSCFVCCCSCSTSVSYVVAAARRLLNQQQRQASTDWASEVDSDVAVVETTVSPSHLARSCHDALFESSYTQLLNAGAFYRAVFMMDTVLLPCCHACDVMLHVAVCAGVSSAGQVYYTHVEVWSVLTVNICLSREVVMYCILVFVFTFCIDCT